MTLEQMKRVTSMGAKLEIDARGAFLGPNAHLHSMRHWRQATNKETAEQIKAIGAENLVTGTNLGQTGNPSQPDGYAMLMAGLVAEGISRDQIKVTGREVPGGLQMG
jgi:hypothetical protein